MSVEIKSEPEEEQTDTQRKEEPNDEKEKEQEAKKVRLWFECIMCGLREQFDEKGKQFTEQKYVSFATECYIMRDPFTHPSQRQFLILGSDCGKCNHPVCASAKCSIFYEKRFCQKCAFAEKGSFPVAVQSKIIDSDDFQ